MKKFLFSGVLLLTTIVVSVYAWRYSTTPWKGNASDMVDRPSVTREARSAVGANPQENIPKSEQAEPSSTQYIGPMESETSLRGPNARIYHTYDDETLKALADGGDVMAIKEVAHRLIRNSPSQEFLDGLTVEEEREFWEKRKQKKKKYLELAIVYGDTELFDHAEDLYGEDYDISNPVEVREALLEKLAFFEFVAMRGNQSRKYASVPGLINVYGERLKEPLVLTEDDKAFIRERAQAIYDSYETQRENLGLGPFENIEEYHRNIPGYEPFQEYQETMGDNAF